MTLFHSREGGLPGIPFLYEAYLYDGFGMGGWFCLSTFNSCVPLQRQDRSVCMYSMDETLQRIIYT